MRTKYNFRTQSYINIQVNIGFTFSFEPLFPFKCCQNYQDMFNQEFNFQNIFKQESSEIANTYFLPSKNQARFSFFSFIPSKDQARQKLLEKAQSRSRQEFLHPKARDQILLISDGMECVLKYSVMLKY